MEAHFEEDDNDLDSLPTTSSSLPRTPKIFDRFGSSSSSDDDISPSSTHQNPNSTSNGGGVKAAGKKLDYMIQFLDRKLSKVGSANSSSNGGSGAHNFPLPEFVGSGGGTGIFKLPVRSAVRPDRPPCVEVRPRPRRETQVGRALKTMVSIDTQLWCGGENSVRCWEFSEIFSCNDDDDGGGGGGGCGCEEGECECETEAWKSGDEMTARYRESAEVASEVVCMVGDEGERVVWSGHKDGSIRGWRMDDAKKKSGFKECLCWQAHRGPVLSMVMTSYGDLWSGSENGIIKIWSWEAIEKSLSLKAEERHMASLDVERSYIDLKSQVTINGVCYMFVSDVKYLLSNHATAKVWSAGVLSTALWDARTRELLKVFNTDGQVETWGDASSSQDLTTEDEMKSRYVVSLKKEKPQAAFGFLQRSRNAILGAADAVRRAAVKGPVGDEHRRTEAMVSTIDGMVWTGSSSGLLVQWDGNGNRLQEFQHHPFAALCLCTYGSRIWVSYSSGVVQVVDLEGKLLGSWVAHGGPVVKLVVGSAYMFTLAGHGGIRAWNITSPGPIDNLIRAELSGKEFLYTRQENLKILSGTWNVAQGRASYDSLISWLGSASSDTDVVVVGFQELEMGAGVLAMSAAKETVGLEGSAVGQWWLDTIGYILDEGSTYERVGSRQLAGLLIAVWVRKSLEAHVGDVDAAAVPCGFGRAIGNKVFVSGGSWLTDENIWSNNVFC